MAVLPQVVLPVARWPSLSPRLTSWFALLVLCAFAAPVALRFSGLVVRSTYRHTLAYNEGWNVYYANAASAGRLYRAPPDRLAANYPPLSFHISAMLGDWLHGSNFAGRVISLGALLWVALCVSFIVYRASADPWAAAFAALFCIAWFCFFAPSCVGVNDPQMLGHAIMLTAAALYVASEDYAPLLFASCIVFCIGGFTKHNLVAFPIAVSLDVFLRSRRRFALWAATAAGAVALLAGLTLWVDGPYALRHILSPRRYYPSQSVFLTGIYLRIFIPALSLATIWCLTQARQSKVRFLAFALGIALSVGVLFAGGAGVFVNVFYDAIIVLAIIAGLVLAQFTRRLPAGSPAWCAALVVIPIVFSAGPILSGLYSTPPSRQSLALGDRTYADDVAYLKARPGPAICFDLQLCYDAGKPLAYEQFITRERIAAGRLDERILARELDAGMYSVIQSEEGLTYLPRQMMDSLRSHYRIDRRSARAIFYVPVSAAAEYRP